MFVESSEIGFSPFFVLAAGIVSGLFFELLEEEEFVGLSGAEGAGMEGGLLVDTFVGVLFAGDEGTLEDFFEILLF